MTKQGRLFLIAAIGIGIAVPLLLWLSENCDAEAGADCVEFWFNRYQTFIGAMLALGAAWVTLRSQSSQRFYDFLRVRSQQLHHELTLLMTMASALDVAMAPLVEIVSTAQQSRALLAFERGRMEAAEQYLSQAVAAFRDGIGPAWGNTATQAARRTALDIGYGFSSRYVNLLRIFGVSQPISAAELEPFVHELVAQQTSMRASADEFWQAINAESTRIAPLIQDLEQRLLR